MIHSSSVVQLQNNQTKSIHVHRHHAVRIAIAAAILVKQYAHVHQDILVHHHNADPNVLFHRNVHQIEHVSIINVLIHVRILVALDLFVMPAITIQFALVQLVSLAIHLHNAGEFVSLIYCYFSLHYFQSKDII